MEKLLLYRMCPLVTLFPSAITRLEVCCIARPHSGDYGSISLPPAIDCLIPFLSCAAPSLCTFLLGSLWSAWSVWDVFVVCVPWCILSTYPIRRLLILSIIISAVLSALASPSLAFSYILRFNHFLHCLLSFSLPLVFLLVSNGFNGYSMG